MNKKQTKKSSCCSTNKLHFLLIAFIILVVWGVILLSTHDKQSEGGLIADKTQPTIEMISDMAEVILPEESDNKKKVTEILPVVEKKPLMVLDKKPLAVQDPIIALQKIAPEKIVKQFLGLYNQERFRGACYLMSDIKCNDKLEGAVARFGEEFAKMDNGYQNVSVKQVDVPDFHSDIVCVEYDYRYKASTNPKLIHEIISFYLQDGKIAHRVCEEKTRDGINIGCPIKSRRNFCL